MQAGNRTTVAGIQTALNAFLVVALFMRLLQRARRAWTARATLISFASRELLEYVYRDLRFGGTCCSGLDARGRREPLFLNLVMMTVCGGSRTAK